MKKVRNKLHPYVAVIDYRFKTSSITVHETYHKYSSIIKFMYYLARIFSLEIPHL